MLKKKFRNELKILKVNISIRMIDTDFRAMWMKKFFLGVSV